jgi:hypothetical protein
MSYQKVVISGRILEHYNYAKSLPKQPQFRKKCTKREISAVVCVSRSDNLVRRKKSFERLVYANLVGKEMPVLLSLTMFEVTGLAFAYQSLKSFMRRVRSLTPSVLRYIAVPEYQQRGAIHFHVILWGLPEHIIINETPHWDREEDIGSMDKIQRGSRLLQHLWQFGFLDCTSTDGSPRLARYLSKYLSKSMSDIRVGHARAYTSSHNVLRSVSLSSSSSVGYALDAMRIKLSTTPPLLEHHFDTQWLGECRYRRYLLDNR